MSKPNFIERRQFIREKRILTIKYKLAKTSKRNADKNWHLSTTENMSANGLAFTTEQPFLPGDILELHAVMAGVLDVFNGFGTVVWCQKKEEGDYYRIGVRYSNLIPKKKGRKVSVKRRLVKTR